MVSRPGWPWVAIAPQHRHLWLVPVFVIPLLVGGGEGLSNMPYKVALPLVAVLGTGVSSWFPKTHRRKSMRTRLKLEISVSPFPGDLVQDLFFFRIRRLLLLPVLGIQQLLLSPAPGFETGCGSG